MSVILPPNSGGTTVNTLTTGGKDTFAGLIADGVNANTNFASVNPPVSGITLRLQEVAVAAAPVDGGKATYSAAVTGLLPTAAATTVLLVLTGSATKLVKLTHVLCSGTIATAALYLDWQVTKHSTLAAGGTPAAQTAVPHDSNNTAATASVTTFTGAGPTAGTLIGIMATGKTFAPITGTPAVTPGFFEVSFGSRPGAQCPTLRSATQQIGVTINNVTPANAPNLDISIEWTEE